MKLRPHNITKLHQSFVDELPQWNTDDTLSDYLLCKGLVHLWHIEGPGSCREYLLNIPYFVNSYLEQDSAIWLLRVWTAITPKEVEHLYLDKVSSWSQQDCVERSELLDVLKEIFYELEWEDPEAILEEKQLRVLEQNHGIKHWKTRVKQSWLDFLRLEPHEARIKLEEHLSWALEHCPDKEENLYCIGRLSDLALQEGNLLLATDYADQVLEYVQVVYPDNETEQIDFTHRLIDLYQAVGQDQKASDLMERWFELWCVNEEIHDRVWAEDILKMAEFIEFHSPVRALELYEEAIKVLKEELDIIHPTTRDALRNQAIVYGQNGQFVEAMTSIEQLICAMTVRYGEHSVEVISLRVDKAMIYAKHPSNWYLSLDICDEILVEMNDPIGLDQEETLAVLERVLFFYASHVKDFDERGYEIDKKTKAKAMQRFNRYASQIETEYPVNSLERHQLLSYKSDFCLWDENYEDAQIIIEQRLQQAESWFGKVHEKTSAVFHDLLALHKAKEEWSAALRALQQALEIDQRLHGTHSEEDCGNRKELFGLQLQNGAQEDELKHFLSAWLDEATDDLEEDAPEWIDVYCWQSEAHRDLGNPRIALEYQQQSCDRAESLFGRASDQHLDMLVTKCMVLRDISERDEYVGWLEVLAITEEELGTKHATTIMHRENCIDNNPQETEEDFLQLAELVEKQWTLLELPLSELKQAAEDVQVLCATLVETSIAAWLELGDEEALEHWLNLASELEEALPFLLITQLRVMFLCEDWSQCDVFLSKLESKLEQEHIYEGIEDLLEELQEVGLRKGAKKLRRWLRKQA